MTFALQKVLFLPKKTDKVNFWLALTIFQFGSGCKMTQILQCFAGWKPQFFNSITN